MRSLTLLCLGLLVPTLAPAQGRYDQLLTIGRVDSVQSAALQETRPYLVYLPPSYDDTTWTPARYPVLYLLDGDAHFQSVAGLIQIQGSGVNGTYRIPEMIVVAIPNKDRTRDLTPTHTDLGFDGKPAPFLKTSGGNANFFRFLTAELIPRIDSAYRTMPYRVLVGHSFGGITTLNALYTIPGTFNAYLAIDPSLWWDHQVLLREARSYFGSAHLAGKALYVAQANTINPADTTTNLHFESIVQFNAVMGTFNRSGLRYGYRYYDHDDHGSVPMIAEYDGLRFIFDAYNLPLARVFDAPRTLTEHFREASAQLGATFVPSERMIATLSSFAAAQDTAKAIEFATIQTEVYPRSYRGYERLGDLWAGKGDQARARDCYQQALARAPGNRAIQEKLAKSR